MHFLSSTYDCLVLTLGYSAFACVQLRDRRGRSLLAHFPLVLSGMYNVDKYLITIFFYVYILPSYL